MARATLRAACGEGSRRFVKMKFAQKTRYRFRFLFVFFYPKGFVLCFNTMHKSMSNFAYKYKIKKISLTNIRLGLHFPHYIVDEI